MTLTPPDVVGVAELLEMLSISRQGFDKSHRHRDGFPPARELANGPVWERRAVDAYNRQRKTGKPYMTALELYRLYHGINGAPLARIGRELELSTTTVRRYLQQLGEIPR